MSGKRELTENLQDVSIRHSGSEIEPLVPPSSTTTTPRHPNGGPPSSLLPRRRVKGENQSLQQRHKHPNSELVTVAAPSAGGASSERRPLLSRESGLVKAEDDDGEEEDDDDNNDDDDQGNFITVLSTDCPSVVSGDARSDALTTDDVTSEDSGRKPSDFNTQEIQTQNSLAAASQQRNVGNNDDVRHVNNRLTKVAVPTSEEKIRQQNDVDDGNSIQLRHSESGLQSSGDSRLSQQKSDANTYRDDDVCTLAKRPSSPVRSFTSACIRALGEESEGGAADQNHLHGSAAVRRLSSGDVPHCLLTYQDGSSDVHNMTLVVPGPARNQENYLIGRANPRGDVALVRMTRMTEVAPTTSSIVDDEDQWKMPIHLFTSKKQGKDICQYKAKRIRSYYKAQDQLITAYEDISLKVNDDLLDTDVIKRQRKLATFFSKLTLAVNVALLIAKLVASVLSGSISIISSLVDSVVDLLSGAIMWWATRAVRTRDPYTYPQGRTKLEPVAIIILSVVMALASLQLVRESVEKVVTLVHDPSALPHIQAPVFAIAGTTVVVKLVLWLVCRRVKSSIVQALAMDHRNDVLSNSVAIVCGYLGSQEFQSKAGLQGFIYVDPAGAILISLYIVVNWWQTGSEQIKMLTGYTARPDFLSKLTWTAMNHDPNVRHIDTVRAFHFGNNFLVEMDIVLPEDMSLRVAHDIGESLQQKLENIPEVERAFVHLDYEYSHNPNSEHKVV